MGSYALFASGSCLIALGSTTLAFPIMWIAAPILILPGIGCAAAALRQGCMGSGAIAAILLLSVYFGGWVANLTGNSILYRERQAFSEQRRLGPSRMQPPVIPWGKSYLLLATPILLALIAAAPDEKRSNRIDPARGVAVGLLSFSVYPLTVFFVWLLSRVWGLSA